MTPETAALLALAERQDELEQTCLSMARHEDIGPQRVAWLERAECASRTATILRAAHQPIKDAEDVARLFHEAYERLAPSFGYETHKASAVAWADVPEPNKSLMVAVAAEVLRALAAPQEGKSSQDPLGEALNSGDGSYRP